MTAKAPTYPQTTILEEEVKGWNPLLLGHESAILEDPSSQSNHQPMSEGKEGLPKRRNKTLSLPLSKDPNLSVSLPSEIQSFKSMDFIGERLRRLREENSLVHS